MINATRQSKLVTLAAILAVAFAQNKAIDLSIAYAQAVQVAGYQEADVTTPPDLAVNDIPLVRLQSETHHGARNNVDDLSDLFYQAPPEAPSSLEQLEVKDGKASKTKAPPKVDYTQFLNENIRIVGFMSGGVIIGSTFYTVGSKLTLHPNGAPAEGVDRQMHFVIKDIRAKHIVISVGEEDYVIQMR